VLTKVTVVKVQKFKKINKILLYLTERNKHIFVFQRNYIVLKVVFDLTINTDIEILIPFINFSSKLAIIVH